MLLDEIRASPDDDAPRLVYADALAAGDDPPRGELIALQCAIARGELPRADAIRARRRADELLAQHGDRWASGLAGLATRWSFARGFVDRARVDARVFVERGAELVQAAPLLRRLDVTGLVSELGDDTDYPLELPEAHAVIALARRVIESPHLDGIPMLDLGDVRVRYSYMGEMSMYERGEILHGQVFEVLEQTGRLRRLRGLALDRPSPHTVRQLLTSEQAAGLEDVELAGFFHELELPAEPPVRPRRLRFRDEDTMPFRFERHAALMSRVTDLGKVVPPVPAALAPQLRALAVATPLYTDPLRALVAEPGWGELRELEIEVTYRGRDFEAQRDAAFAPLLAADHLALRVLRLAGMVLDQPFLDALFASPLARRLEVIDLLNGWRPELDASGFDGVVRR